MKVRIGKERLHGNFNKTSIAQTSCNVGEVQPTLFRSLIKGEQFSINNGIEVKLLPMSAPTFGALSVKQYYSAIKLCDLYRPIHAFYSGKPYSFGDRTMVIPTLQKAPLAQLFFYLLRWDLNACFGLVENAFVSSVDGHFYGNDRTVVTRVNPYPTVQTIMNQVKTFVGSAFDTNGLQLLFDSIVFASNEAYFANNDGREHEVTGYAIDPHVFVNTLPDNNLVTEVSGFDYLLPLDTMTGADSHANLFYAKAIGVRLGEFGRKLRKLFIGLGFNIDALLSPFALDTEDSIEKHLPWLSTEKFNFFPFLGYAKAIYDAFGVKKFTDYPQTFIGRFVQNISNSSSFTRNGVNAYVPTSSSFGGDKHATFTDNPTTGGQFFANLGIVLVEALYNGFYTLDLDQFSQCNNTVGDSVNQLPNVNAVVESSDSPVERLDYAYVNSTEVGSSNPYQPIIQNIANRLLHYVNTDNVIGASLYKWFKEKYGIIVDNDQTLKSTIIARDMQRIDIDALMSTSGEQNTSIENNGSRLGDYTGRGYARGKMPKTCRYTASDFTYLYSFMCIVPRVGYYQGINPEFLRGSEKWDYYTPEMDSMGYVPQSSQLLHGSTNGVNGLVPRYMDYKFDNGDVVNGDLTIQSRARAMAPYFYQRMINGSHTLSAIQSGQMVFTDQFRKIGLDDRLGNFLRIFQNTDSINDHFIINIVHDIKSTAPMKPIVDSFDTVDDEQSAEVVNKA